MCVSLLVASCLLIICIRHFLKYVVGAAPGQRPLSVTIFYITSLITIFAILSYTAISYTSEKDSHTLNFVLLMAALAEVGIQIIAISQASSAMELGLYLRDIRNDTKTQVDTRMASPGKKANTTWERKSVINTFLWVHVVIFFLVPLGFGITSSFLIDIDDIQSVDELRNNQEYMQYLLASLIVQSCINIYIAILLTVIQGRTIFFLKKQFGEAFKKETT